MNAFYSSKKKLSRFSQKYEAAQQLYWSNDAENSALYHRNKLHIQTKQLFQIVIIFHNITVFTVFLIK